MRSARWAAACSAMSSISAVSKPAISRNRRARRMADSSSSPRRPRKLNSPSTVFWNSRARVAAVGVVLGDLAQPGGAHLHVGHLVGQHPVLGEAQDRVVHVVGEVAHRGEHVDGEAFEGAVDAGQPEHRVGVAGGLEQRDGLAVLADLGPHVVAELHRDLDVAGLVPALAGHVELQRERDLVGGRSRRRCVRHPRGPGSRRRRCRASAAGPDRPPRRPPGPSGAPRRRRGRVSANRSAVVIRWNRSSRARASGGSSLCMGEAY